MGVDGSQANAAAVGFTFEAASARQAPLLTLRAGKQPAGDIAGRAPASWDDAERAAAEALMLTDAVDR